MTLNFGALRCCSSSWFAGRRIRIWSRGNYLTNSRGRAERLLVTKFDHSGDGAPPSQNSNSVATTSNPRTRTARMSASLETTVEAGKSLTGEPLRNPLTAKQRSSPTWLRWVRASPDPYLRGSSPCGQYAPAAASRKAEASCKALPPVGERPGRARHGGNRGA